MCPCYSKQLSGLPPWSQASSTVKITLDSGSFSQIIFGQRKGDLVKKTIATLESVLRPSVTS